MRGYVGCGIVAVLVLFATSFGHLRAQAPANANEWLLHGRTEGETRFSPLARINPKTVKDLGLAWSFATETNRGIEATPIVVDGVIYLSAAAGDRVRR